MTEDTNSISRRNVLAGLGTIGVGGALVGAGTSAFFSDEESLDGNTLATGELDLRIDWQQLYYGMPEDHYRAPYGSAGRPFVNRLGVKWFERLRLSSSRKTPSSVRPRGFLLR